MNNEFIIKKVTMTQVLKDDVRSDIIKASLNVFIKKGFIDSKISDIAKEAGISTGNIYNYFNNKEELFYTAINPEIAEKLITILEEKFRKVIGTSIDKLNGEDSLYFEELTNALIKNRYQYIILFSNAKGTKYENYFDILLDKLILLVEEYSTSAGVTIKSDLTRLMRIIYRNIITGIIEILNEYSKEAEIAMAIKYFFIYHFKGIIGFLKRS